MRKFKKFISIGTASAMVMSLLMTGCGNTDANQTNGESTEQGTAQSSSEIETETDGQSDAGETTHGLDGIVRTELTATEFAVLMGNGINLGNTMECYKHNSNGDIPSAYSCEKAWGQPTTTQEMISGMKAAGFDTLRIPVAWTNGMYYEEGDYTISEDYLNRVEEIVNYALNEDMYVIINDHWDGSWWGMFGSATPETVEGAFDMYEAMWTQIANRFADYGDYVIFESANEELGDRLNDTDICEDSGSLSENECYEMLTKINQTFVDTVRATGGNNANRFLLIAGYNTDITKTCDDRYVMPTDTANEKLLLSVHYYTPWGYCGSTVEHWGTADEYDEMNTLFAKLAKFTDAGIPVIIGEYAAMDKGHNVKPNTDIFTKNLLANCDLYGCVPILWDCNNQYNKDTCSMSDETCAEIYLNNSYAAQKDMTQEEVKAAAQATMDELYAAAVAEDAAGYIEVDEDAVVAWIMYNTSSWDLSYSVGDEYDPNNASNGIQATDVVIDGEGTYTVALDFTETDSKKAADVGFAALGIYNGMAEYPDYEITIDSVKINGEEKDLVRDGYTTSDDDNTTRVNLCNTYTNNENDVIINKDDWKNIQTLEITFTYAP